MKRPLRSIAAKLGYLAVIPGLALLTPVQSAGYTAPKMTMADGRQLVTIVRLPEGKGPFPTVIVRSPYPLPHTPLSGLPSEDLSNVPEADLPKIGWKPVTEAGYALVIQHTPGRFGSDGMMLDTKDRQDSLELISWIRDQPWSNGKIGTAGDSIEAMMAMITNSANPPVVDASFAQLGSPNLVNETLKAGGALKLETFLPWMAEHMLTAEGEHFDAVGIDEARRQALMADMAVRVQDIFSDMDNPHTLDAWKHLPLKDYPVFSEVSPAWNDLLNSTSDSPLATHFDATETKVPTYHVAAWFDVFAPSQLSSFARAEALGVEQRLLVLNGTHFTAENPGAWPIQPMLPWFDYHLKGEREALLDLPRVIFPIANGDDEWYGTDTWPPKAVKPQPWSLTANGKLLPPTYEASGGIVRAAETDAGSRRYAYDPANPVPTIGGRNLLITNGPRDQQTVRQAHRADVLSYDSEPLTEDVVLAGQVFANVSVSSDAPDTDFTVKVMDLALDGTATLVAEGIQRARFRDGPDKEVFLTPGQVYPLRIDLGHIAWRFKSGHRIAVDISSSNFPQWDRNLNVDQPLYGGTDQQIANNSVHHGADVGSIIELPVVMDLQAFELLAEFKTSVDEQGGGS